jgi:methylglutaconyl-CoA hydratase
LVLASDLVVGCPEAQFGFPEPKRGVVSGLCAPLLHFRAGGRHAARLLLTATAVSAERAVEMGLYDELVANDVLWARSMDLAKEISHTAPEAIQLTKRTLNEMIGEDLELHLSSGAAASATSRTTEAAKEGLAAFVEKRDPQWP